MKGVYDILYIFEYSPDRYKNLILRIFKSYWVTSYNYGDGVMCDLDAYIAGFKEDYFRDVE
jgi:hypothetical protein